MESSKNDEEYDFSSMFIGGSVDPSYVFKEASEIKEILYILQISSNETKVTT